MDHVSKTIEDILASIHQKELAIVTDKKLVNGLCVHAGRSPMFPDIEQPQHPGRTTAFKRDQFYDVPLSTAVREVLVHRKSLDLGPATVDELYDAMSQGGYPFESEASEAKRGLKISLTKNSATFCRLPHGTYGLREWYKGKEPREPRAVTAANEPTQVVATKPASRQINLLDEFDGEEKEKAADAAAK